MGKPEQQQDPWDPVEDDPVPDCGEESYRGNGQLEGKVAVITGADCGIGRAVAIAYAREGADVLISYLTRTTTPTRSPGSSSRPAAGPCLVPGDISDPQHCRDIIDTAVREFGGLDILVNNAAYQMSHETLEEIPDEEWEYTSPPTSAPSST